MRLLESGYTEGTYKFLSTDTKELYEKNLKLQQDDWHYRTSPVNYQLNTQGYRCKEWNEYDWNNSIVLMGGSDIFGAGVDETETVSYYIKQLSGIDTINLGVNAISPMFLWINSILLAKENIQPKAIVYVWPDPSRSVEFIDSEGFNNKKMGIWEKENNFGKLWATHRFQGVQSLRYYMMNINLMWKCPCLQYPPLYVEIPWLKLTDELKLPMIDNSRDVVPNSTHFGPSTYYSWAEKFLNDLKLSL